MKIVTWNINGIRSLKKDIDVVLNELNSDISCFQETKISRSQLPENIALIDGYTSYFSYARKQSGYSGVATYCKDACLPEDAEEGIVLTDGSCNSSSLSNSEAAVSDIQGFDFEGRIVITFHLIKYEQGIQRLAIINVYCPRVDPEKPERQLYKMQFCHLLEAKAKELCNKGCFVIIVGDFNIACSIIDHCDPCNVNEFNASEARQWLRNFLSSKADCEGEIGMIDAFRHFYPDRKNAYTCWNVKIGARLTNYGTRIDYIIISSNMLPLLQRCEIMSDYDGSDHCPVMAEFKCESIPEENNHLPSICTRLWPEFSGRQQKLHSFFQKTKSDDCITKCNKVNIQSVNSKIRPLKRKEKQKSIASFFKCVDTMKNTAKVSNEEQNECVSSKQLKFENGEISLSSVFHENRGSCPTVASAVSNNDNTSTSSPKNKVSEWKDILKGPPKPPLCSGHSKECVLKTVKKKGPNYGRQFFMCSQPAGHSSNPDASCNFFKWISAPKINTLK